MTCLLTHDYLMTQIAYISISIACQGTQSVRLVVPSMKYRVFSFNTTMLAKRQRVESA